jgi:hypothetical protein
MGLRAAHAMILADISGSSAKPLIWRAWASTSLTSAAVPRGARQPGAEAGPPQPREDHGRAGELVQCLRRNRTASTMITMITMTPKLMNMGCSIGV